MGGRKPRGTKRAPRARDPRTAAQSTTAPPEREPENRLDIPHFFFGARSRLDLLPARATVAGIANAGPRAGAPARRSRGARRLGGATPAFASSRSRSHPRGHPRRAVPPAFATSGQGFDACFAAHRTPLVLRSGPDGSPPRAEAWRRALRSASPCGRRAGRCGPSGAVLFGRRLCPARIASARHPASLRRPGCSPPAHARCGFAIRSESRLRAISAPIRRPCFKLV